MFPISDQSHSSEVGLAVDRKIALMADLLEQLQEHSVQLRNRERSFDQQQSEDRKHLSQRERNFDSEESACREEWRQRERDIAQRETSLAVERQRLEELRTALETERIAIDAERLRLPAEHETPESSRVESKHREPELQEETDSPSETGRHFAESPRPTDEVIRVFCREADSTQEIGLPELEDLYEIEEESVGSSLDTMKSGEADESKADRTTDENQGACDEVAAYMERLLSKRSKRKSESAPTPDPTPIPDVPETTHEKEFCETDNLSPTPRKPRAAHDRDAIRAGMDSMREIANLTARSAIAHSHSKRFRNRSKRFGDRLVKATLAGLGTAWDFVRSLFSRKRNHQPRPASSDKSPQHGDSEESPMNEPQGTDKQ